MVKDLTSAERARLPRYTGELLLVNHSAGAISSEAYMKKWNRKNELLADAAERACVAATWLGAENYPSDRLSRAWDLVLGSQMHDMLPGTSLPLAYQFCWNDETLAQNQFTAALRDGMGGVAAAMDTTGSGEAVVVYNPLSVAREDVVEARVHFPGGAPEAVHVIGPDGAEVPSQVISRSLDELGLIFVARVPSVGFQHYRVERAAGAGSVESGALHASTSGLENERYRVVIAATGDIESIFDKAHGREPPCRADAACFSVRAAGHDPRLEHGLGRPTAAAPGLRRRPGADPRLGEWLRPRRRGDQPRVGGLPVCADGAALPGRCRQPRRIPEPDRLAVAGVRAQGGLSPCGGQFRTRPTTTRSGSCGGVPTSRCTSRCRSINGSI